MNNLTAREIIKLRALGFSFADIARRCGTSRQAISQTIKRWLDAKDRTPRKAKAARGGT